MAYNFHQMMPGLDFEELQFLQEISKDLPEEKMQTFASIYSGKRQKPDMILIGGLIGLFGIGGVQRFLVGQIGMGILFFLTCGLCFIGTIVDLVNYKKLALEYNQRMAYEALQMTHSIG